VAVEALVAAEALAVLTEREVLLDPLDLPDLQVHQAHPVALEPSPAVLSLLQLTALSLVPRMLALYSVLMPSLPWDWQWELQS